MRILHVGPSGLSARSEHGGALQRRMLDVAREQLSLGHEVLVLSAEGETRSDVIKGVPVLGLHVRLRRPARDYEFYAAARFQLRGQRFDVLHAHGSPGAALFLRDLAERSVQTVDFFRYTLSNRRLGHAYYSHALSKHDSIMAVSDYCARELRNYYPEMHKPVVMVPNGVDLDHFRPDTVSAAMARQELNLPDGPLVVYLGRVCHQKGSDLLGALGEQLRRRGSDAHVVAVGPAEQFGTTGRSALMDQLQTAGVICTGAVHDRLLRGILNAATVFVLPTRQDEMFGMAALEAIACGTPVVASDLGGIPQAIGPVGRLFPVGDIGEFSETVTALMDDPDEIARLSSLSRAHAAKFAWAAVANQTLRVYTGSAT